ncbi:unnamed protein product [Leptidea sinapis]|uniref:Uncharacterized protein n=1 Tax=Leptidea sinapis TaxID=189913 RepID=A0A5E4QIJ4_9NEOP|nr:unnamed protein product [Leptidea sinapis]
MENGLKLKEFQVQSVEPTAYYIPDFVTVDEEKNLLSKLYEVPKPKWTQLSNRSARLLSLETYLQRTIRGCCHTAKETATNAKSEDVTSSGGQKKGLVLAEAGQGVCGDRRAGVQCRRAGWHRSLRTSGRG